MQKTGEPIGVQMFFYLSKLFWLLAQPLSAAFLLVVVGVGLIVMRKVRWGLGILSLSLLVQGAFGFTNLGYILIQPLEDRFPMVTEPPEEVGTIIMLGGATLSRPSTARQIAELNDAGDRLTATLWLAVRYPRARIVISGGSGLMGDAGEAEAETAARFFIDHGVPRERLVLEDQSRNTEENVANTAGLLDGDELPVVVVTSAFHMPRSIGIFRQAGMDVTAWPTDYRSPGPQMFGIDLANPIQNINVSTVALKEWIGLVVYHWTGRTSELLPSPETTRAARAARLPSISISSGAAEEADEEGDDEEGEEQEEQDLRNTGRSTCNAPETENSCDQSNHQKDQGIVKHGCLQEVVDIQLPDKRGVEIRSS